MGKKIHAIERIKNDGPFYRKLVRVALPISLQSLIASSLAFVDNLMIGNLGETELATVALSTQIYFIFYMMMYGFTGGTITYMSQYWGVRDLANIRRVAGFAISVAFGAGLIFFIAAFFFPRQILSFFTDIPQIVDLGVPYIRNSAIIFLTWSIVIPLTALLKATQQTSLPLKISIAVFSINTILAVIFIFGLLGAPRLGIMGACLAIVTSRIVELFLYIFVIFVRKNIVAAPIKEFFTWNKALVGNVIRNSIPTTMNELIWAAGISMYSVAIGHMGETEIASFQACNTILNIVSLFCFSIGDAMLILVGEKLGAGELEESITTSKKILKVAVALGIVAGIILITFSRFIVVLFNFTPEGEMLTKRLLLVLSCVLFIKVFNSTIIVGVLRAGGDARFGMIAEASTVWLIGVPIAFIFAMVLKLPVYWVVLGIQTEEIVKFFIMLYRYKSRKWVRNLIDD